MVKNKTALGEQRPAFWGTLSDVLDLKVIKQAKGRVLMRLPWSKQASQTAGLLHGGALATLMDTAAAVGTLALLKPGWRTVTAELKINYVGNIHSGAALAEARLVHHGRHTMVWEVRVREEGKNKLLALSTTTFFLLPPA